MNADPLSRRPCYDSAYKLCSGLEKKDALYHSTCECGTVRNANTPRRSLVIDVDPRRAKNIANARPVHQNNCGMEDGREKTRLAR